MMENRLGGQMDFSQKYDLIELLPGKGVQSYRARQTNTGRDGRSICWWVTENERSWCGCGPCNRNRWRS
jgi:hypothetical protein